MNRRLKDDAIEDPAMVATTLFGVRNAVVIPAGRGISIDIHELAVWDELATIGLRADSSGRLAFERSWPHYGFVPESIDMLTLRGTFAGGEIRRSATGD